MPFFWNASDEDQNQIKPVSRMGSLDETHMGAILFHCTDASDPPDLSTVLPEYLAPPKDSYPWIKT